MKKRISILLILTILTISFNVPVFANEVTPVWNVTYEPLEAPDAPLVDSMMTWHFQDSINHSQQKKVTLEEYMASRGFITDNSNYTTAKNWVKTIIANNPNAFGGKTEDQVTNQDLQNWLQNNITITNTGSGNVQFTTSGDFNNTVSSIEESIMGDKRFWYCYAYDLQDSFNNFPNGDVYNAFRRFIVYINETYGSNYICIFFNWQNHYDAYYIKLDNTNGLIINQLFTDYATVMMCGQNGGLWYAPSAEYFGRGSYNGTDFVINPNEFTYPYYVYDNLRNVVRMARQPHSIGVTNHDQPCVYAFETNQIFEVWHQQDFTNRGSVSDNGYFITDSYNSNTTGSYNTSTSNIDNSITYGDITNYINTYKEQNEGEEPTVNDINIYINNYIPDNPTPTPTPGPTDPTPTPTPGPSDPGGDDDDSEGIFDFLSKIGEVLGNLIKNLGNILAELIDGITEVISKIVGIIPNIFRPLFEYIFAGLPDELVALIELGITVMVIVGIIRLFKG